MKKVSNVLRAAIVESERRGVSLYRIAKETKLDDSIVYRFYHDECGLALSSVDRLCLFLGLELRPAESSARLPETVKVTTRKKKKVAKKKKKKATARKKAKPKTAKKAPAKKKRAAPKKTKAKTARKRTAKKRAKRKS